jgi:outer membrane receptor protein involved in Fe transport
MGSTILVGAFAAGMAGAATAQVTPTEQSAGVSPTTANATPATEEVVVTGSRIRSPNLTSVSPMAVVTDQEVKLEGATNIENLLNSLPQVVAGQQSNVSNGASGTATVDLRGLGPSRTLVLVDGKRLMPGDPSLPYADLNNIPSAMVDRVEVVTGGASAVYGADAVAGVVNFILKKDFQGVQIDAQYGFAQHDNDNTEFRSLQGTQGISNFPQAPGDYTASLSKEVSAIIGANAPDGKGNITAYATWRELEPITQNNYDVSACSLALKNNGKGSSYNYNTHFCSGSSNSQYGRFNVVTANGTGGTLHDNPNGTQTLVSTSVPAYNYAPQNYFQRPEDRYTAGFNANYEVNKMLDIYSSLMFADDHTVAQIAPSGLFAGTGPNGGSTYQINCNNPLLSASEATQLCGAAAGTPAVANALIGYRFAGYNRQDDLRHTNYKIDIGARGELAPGWNYDAYLQYGTTIYSEEYVNDASTTKIQNALLVDPTTGKCENDASTCVPLNIFQYGGLTKAAVQYALTPGFKNGQTVEQIADISVTGDLGQYGMKSPWATDGIGVAFGTEYRRESLDLNVDQEFSSGDLSGQGGPTKGVSGSFDVYELFGEMRVPIVQDMPFVKSLTTDIGYRFSDYSSTGTTNTYKIDLDWAIDSNFRLRSGYNRAVRAPNIDELYAPSSVGDTSASDPCAGLTTYTQACLNTFSTLAAKEGKTEAQVAAGLTNIAQCPAAQCSGLFGGNANLTPETADTYTAGIVFTPTWSWSRGFSASIDYYNIQVYNAITSIATQNIINQCEAGVASFCNLINRDPSSGILFGQTGYVTDTDINSGYNKTQGVDVAATYTFRPTQWGLPNWGSLNVNLIATEVFKFQIQPVAQGGSYDCTGLYGPTCGTPLPRLRTKVRFTYTPPSFPAEFSLDWRHLSGVKLDANEGNPLLHNLISGVITDSADEQIDAYDYFDFSVLWHVRDNLSARAGVSNLFDKDPPGLDSNYLPASGPPEGNGNTYPGVYDSLGRTFFVGLTADF